MNMALEHVFHVSKEFQITCVPHSGDIEVHFHVPYKGTR